MGKLGKIDALVVPVTFVKDQGKLAMRKEKGFPDGDDHMCGYFIEQDGSKIDVFIDAVKTPYRRMFCGTTIKMPKYGSEYLAVLDLFTNEVIGLCDGKRYDVVYHGYIFTGRVDDEKSFNVRRWQKKVVATEKEIHITAYMMTDQERADVEKIYKPAFSRVIPLINAASLHEKVKSCC